MKKLIAIMILGAAWAIPAQAVTLLKPWPVVCGNHNCDSHPGHYPDETNTTTWATFRMATILGCAPNSGMGCDANPGETYALHINIRCDGGGACAHAYVTAKAGPYPTVGQTLTWTNVTFSGYCSVGHHGPQGQF